MIVVDTNILVYRWIVGASSMAADTLARRQPDWISPPLWRSELRNVLAGYLRRREMTLPEAEFVLENAAKCLLAGEYSISDELVLRLVLESNCSAYDCEFVALAISSRTVLVTEDRPLLRSFPHCCLSLDQAIMA